MRILLSAVLIVFAACTHVPAETGKTYQVYFLGGQSNMVGYGPIGLLDDAQRGPHPDIPIFAGHAPADRGKNGGAGSWTPLQPGFGFGFRATNSGAILSDTFGPELMYGLDLAGRDADRNIAIIKYARGGTSLSGEARNGGVWGPDADPAWRPNQYDFAETTIKNAFSSRDIDGDGKPDTLIPAGIVWMQGEADANSEPSALNYERNLRTLIARLRSAMNAPDIPVIIGKITDSGRDDDGMAMDFAELVQAAQAAVVASDPCAAWVTKIDTYKHQDKWHYTGRSYLQMGSDFAAAMAALEQTCGPFASISRDESALVDKSPS